jgi:hypothetical protein
MYTVLVVLSVIPLSRFVFPDGEAKPRLAFLQCESSWATDEIVSASLWRQQQVGEPQARGWASDWRLEWHTDGPASEDPGSRAAANVAKLRRDPKHEDAWFISQDKEAREQMSETGDLIASTWSIYRFLVRVELSVITCTAIVAVTILLFSKQDIVFMRRCFTQVLEVGDHSVSQVLSGTMLELWPIQMMSRGPWSLTNGIYSRTKLSVLWRVYPLLGNGSVNRFPQKQKRGTIGRPLLGTRPVITHSEQEKALFSVGSTQSGYRKCSAGHEY